MTFSMATLCANYTATQISAQSGLLDPPSAIGLLQGILPQDFEKLWDITAAT